MNQQYFLRVWYGNFTQEIIMDFNIFHCRRANRRRRRGWPAFPSCAGTARRRTREDPLIKILFKLKILF
jgi:hypothetical protein